MLHFHPPVVAPRNSVIALRGHKQRQPSCFKTGHASESRAVRDRSFKRHWTLIPHASAAAIPSSSIEPEQALASASAQHHPVLTSHAQAVALLGRLRQASSPAEKVMVLMQEPSVTEFVNDSRNACVAATVLHMGTREQGALLSLLALGQGHALQTTAQGEPADVPAALSRLAAALLRVEQFYDSVGGLVGYHVKSLDLIVAGSPDLQVALARRGGGGGQEAAACGCGDAAWAAPHEGVSEVSYSVPQGLDVAGEGGRELGGAMAAKGLGAMPFMAEIYPVGGAGDRLGLRDDVTGECLPAAMLPYCGRTMVAGLVRDLQAREYLHYKLTGKQLTTPVAIMTSDAKGNHQRITSLMEACNWFGRGRSAFRLFRQPMVPVLSVEDGRWLLGDQLEVLMKPGGHGAIWKLMLDEGVFQWFNQRGAQAALVRQISNPLAGTDTTLLALAGAGHSRGASFGFMSCERAVGAAEGMNVLQERKTWRGDGQGGGRWQYEYNVTNIEYTEFERLGIRDEACGGAAGASSVFPANTNVLYVGLRQVEAIVRRAVASGSSEELLPGLIFNTKKRVAYTCPVTREARSVAAGRMESTMQNMADSLADCFDRPIDTSASAAVREGRGGGAPQLSTFFVSNLRRKVTSSAKKRREPGSTKIHQTPDGSFFDLQRNAWHLLQLCGMTYVPEVGSVQQYLAAGPGFIFLFHPALGPLWDVVAQKIRGGALMDGAELVLEVAEARLVDVVVDGSLLVHAHNVMGHTLTAARGGGGGGGGRRWLLDEDDEAAGALTIHGVQYGSEGLQVPMGSTRNLSATLDQHRNGQQLEAAAAAGNSEGLFAVGCAEAAIVGGGALMASAAAAGAAAAEQHLLYSGQVGRVQLVNVTVKNAGVDWAAPGNMYWKHQVRRHEAMRIVLHGQSEFEAHDVTIAGDVTFVVPHGYKMVVTAGPSGLPDRQLMPLRGSQPSWQWSCRARRDGSVQLLYQGQELSRRSQDSLEYVI